MSDTYASTPIPGTRLGIGRVIQMTFAMIGRNAGVVLLLSLAYAAFSAFAPVWLGGALRTGSASQSTYAALSTYLNWLPGFLINVLPAAFVTACVTSVVSGDLAGQRPPFGAAAGLALRLMLPVAALTIVASLGVVLGMVLLIVPGILLALRWWVIAPIRVMEGGSMVGAFSRSAALTKGSRGALFGLLAIFGVAVLGIAGVMVLASGGLTAYQMLVVTQDPIMRAVQVVLNAATTAVSATSAAVTYAELRRIKEGALPGQLADVFA